jgi:UDP-glucose 4-epimerase
MKPAEKTNRPPGTAASGRAGVMSNAGEFFHGRNVLVTGGLGFIGSTLAHRLVDLGARVTLLDSLIPEYGGNLFNIEGIRDRAAYHISDVRDPHALRHHLTGQDVLFNLAGQTSHLDSMRAPEADLEINCKAQLSILETCRRVNPTIRIVFAGTRQIYGKPDYLPVDESHPIRPVDVNGINKTAGEWYHLLYQANYGISCCVLRLTNTYGPRMRVADARQTFLGVWLKLLLEGRPIQIYGTGQQRRDLNFVTDVVDALLLAAASDQSNGKVYNLGSSEVVTLQELAELLVEANGSGRFEAVPFPDELKRIDVGDYYGDFRKIEAELGWKPRVTLRDGLRQTLEFYRRFGRQYWK